MSLLLNIQIYVLTSATVLFSLLIPIREFFFFQLCLFFVLSHLVIYTIYNLNALFRSTGLFSPAFKHDRVSPILNSSPTSLNPPFLHSAVQLVAYEIWDNNSTCNAKKIFANQRLVSKRAIKSSQSSTVKKQPT